MTIYREASMEQLWSLLTDTSLLDISLARWLMASITLFATVVAQRVVINAFTRVAQRLAARTKTMLDDMLFTAAGRPASMLILVIGLLLTVHVLQPPAESFPIIGLADQAGRILSIVIGVWFLWRMIEGLAAYFTDRAKQSDSSLDDQLVPFIAKTLRIFLVMTAVLVIAQNMGYSISGLLASLV
jgi:MscS family membrane protein